MTFHLGPSWSFEIEFSIDSTTSNVFLISEPLMPIVSVDAYASKTTLEPSCDIYITVHTGIWPPQRACWAQKHFNKLYNLKFRYSELSVHVSLNSEDILLNLKEKLPEGLVNVDASKVLIFDGFPSTDDSASVSSQEFSERQDQFQKWWTIRPSFIKNLQQCKQYVYK